MGAEQQLNAGVENIETPSGKGAGDENFPVGSFLLPRDLRPHVACFYAFARAADDIADNPDLKPDSKLARLDAVEEALVKGSGDPALRSAEALRQSLMRQGVTDRHARDLLAAFRQDAVTTRYQTWDDLMDYCRLSAAPVGRYLLDLHGEDPALYAQSDPLCDALQVINHLQDCQDDYRELNRVYLPTQWLSGCGIDATELDKSQESAALRTVIDRCLEGTRSLMEAADELPKRLKSRQLAMESAVIVNLAHKLVDELSRRDPLAERVVLSKPQLAVCTLSGILSESFRRRGT